LPNNPALIWIKRFHGRLQVRITAWQKVLLQA